MADIIKLVSEGMTISGACLQVGIVRNTTEQYKKRYPDFAARLNHAVRVGRGEYRVPKADFDAGFRERYFAGDYEEPITPPHLQQLMDVLNAQETFARESRSRKHRVLVLMPPEHAKTSLLMDYVTYRISQDPTFRCVLISSTLNQARKRLGVIQRRLTERKDYERFIEGYGPFKSELRIDSKPWTKDHFTILNAPPGQVDYTVEALGIGGSIYGNRADLILLDDIATQKNQTPAEIAKQWDWVWGEVRSRIRRGGLFVVIGTHMKEDDIYTVMEDKGFFTDKVIFPAIVREPGTDGPFDPGEALWPEQNPMEELLEIKRIDERLFALQYQQNPLPSVGAVFTQEMFENCYDNTRYIGHIPKDCIVVAGVDPSVSNYTAGVVFAVSRKGVRYLVDVWNEKGLTGEGGDLQAGVVEFIVELCSRYPVHTVGVEYVSWTKLINHSFSLKKALFDLGVRHLPIPVGPASGKGPGEDTVISQLSGLFTNGIINIPADRASLTHLMAMRHQFLTWSGGRQHWRQRNDIVKAFRMAEHAAKKVSEGLTGSNDYSHPPVPGYLVSPSTPGYLRPAANA